MIKRTPLFAAMLAVAGSIGIPDVAHAKPLLCGVAEVFISTVPDTNPAYNYWSVYWLNHCDR